MVDTKPSDRWQKSQDHANEAMRPFAERQVTEGKLDPSLLLLVHDAIRAAYRAGWDASLSEQNVAVKAALEAVIEWWKDAQYESVNMGEDGERNRYNDEPEMVKLARIAKAERGA